jgi:hypothetical protein
MRIEWLLVDINLRHFVGISISRKNLTVLTIIEIFLDRKSYTNWIQKYCLG